MKKIHLFAALAGALALAGCSEDYDNWADPQSYSAEEAAAAYGVTIAAGPEAVSVLPDDDDAIELVQITADNDDVDGYALNSITVNGTEVDGTLSDGIITVDAYTLSKIVETENYSRANVARSLTVVTSISVILSTGEALTVDDATTTGSITPVDVDIDAAGYYMLGDWQSWDLTVPTWMTDNGDGTYSVEVTTTGSTNYFKFYAGSYYDSSDWDVVNLGQMGCIENGDDATWGYIVYEGDPVYTDGVQTPIISGKGTWKVTLDMNNITYWVELIESAEEESSETEIWYILGSGIGDGSWSNSSVSDVGVSLYPMAYSAEGVVTYTGYFTTDGFKLIRDIGSWDTQWGYSDGYVKNDGSSGNLWVDEAGYYTVTLDYANDVLTIEAYTGDVTGQSTMGISGSFNSWGFESVENATGSSHLWRFEFSTEEDTELKFLTDSSWATNWGGDTFPSGIGYQNGSNIAVTAGSYVVTFNDIDGGYTFVAE